MSVTGQQKTVLENKKYVGFTKVVLRSVNPTRSELNTLLGKEDSDNDKEINYKFNDKEGNDGIRLSFWLHAEDVNKFFVHNILLSDRPRINKDKNKVQLINSTCDTTWVPFKGDVDEDINGIVPDVSVAQPWFLNFTDKKTNEVKAPKTWRIAISGEDELGTFVKAFLGRLNFSMVGAEAELDPKPFFDEDYTALRELITVDNPEKAQFGYDAPFIILLGVETDADDKTKKYQKVYENGFLPTLPTDFMKFIKPGEVKVSKEWDKKTWNRFEKNLTGQYGFKAYYEICPLSEYDERNDLSSSEGAKGETKAAPTPAPNSSKF